jgi:Protein of unknown function (DUF2634)
MIPSAIDLSASEVVGQPSRTYVLNTKTKRIYSHIDGLEADAQFVLKTLNTERFAYAIYNDQYGVELETLLGQSPDYVKSVLEHRVRDALMADDRFLDIAKFEILEMKDDYISFSVSVLCTHGTVSVESEVR